MRLGTKVIDRRQPSLSTEEVGIIERFHDLYFRRWLGGGDTITLSWLGYEVRKCPLDLWIYQELLVRTQPELVIETGTFRGGSALFLASIMDMLGRGRVITIDIQKRAGRPEHPRVSYWHGSSIDEAIVAEARKAAAASRAMVILDSNHTTEHVYQEMKSFGPLVRVGDYMIVEDTCVNGHPVYPDFGPGPMEAVDRFLGESDEFEIDDRCERFLMTLQPRGFLKRRRAAR